MAIHQKGKRRLITLTDEALQKFGIALRLSCLGTKPTV